METTIISQDDAQSYAERWIMTLTNYEFYNQNDDDEIRNEVDNDARDHFGFTVANLDELMDRIDAIFFSIVKGQ